MPLCILLHQTTHLSDWPGSILHPYVRVLLLTVMDLFTACPSALWWYLPHYLFHRTVAWITLLLAEYESFNCSTSLLAFGIVNLFIFIYSLGHIGMFHCGFKFILPWSLMIIWVYPFRSLIFLLNCTSLSCWFIEVLYIF